MSKYEKHAVLGSGQAILKGGVYIGLVDSLNADDVLMRLNAHDKLVEALQAALVAIRNGGITFGTIIHIKEALESAGIKA